VLQPGFLLLFPQQQQQQQGVVRGLACAAGASSRLSCRLSCAGTCQTQVSLSASCEAEPSYVALECRAVQLPSVAATAADCVLSIVSVHQLSADIACEWHTWHTPACCGSPLYILCAAGLVVHCWSISWLL
jgi:hypothetical protein